MSAIVILISSGLFVYWLHRSWLLAFGQEAEIGVTLNADYWRWRRILIALRTMMLPPMEI